MRLRTRVDALTTTLLAALGAGLLGCGGLAVRESGSGGSGGSGNPGAGGTTSSGGFVSSGSGGFTSSGGASSGGASSGGASSGGASSGSASSGGASSGGSVSTGGGPTGNPFPCLNPTPWIDATSGYEQCANGELRRTHQAQCPSSVPRPEPVPNYDPTDSCQYDSDCTEQAHGLCAPTSEFELPSPGHYCRYGCVSDAECGAGTICVCSDPVGSCQASTCTSSADCEPGFDCLTHDRLPGCPSNSFACQVRGDACGSEIDCGDRLCTAASGVRECALPNCEVGRPFLVHGAERVAPCADRHDWLELEIEPDLEGLTPELRARLADEWARAGQMEHASIAAFARFTLQLLSLGAPADLVEASTHAMADETAHAKLCFALATRYGGKSVGPGALAVEGCLDATSSAEIVTLTIREGCIGETVAAIEAAEAAEHATDPVVRAALRRISADETRHAELAWRFVKWAVDQGGAEIAGRVEREFSEQVRGARASQASQLSADDQSLLACGVVPPALRDVLRARALTEIVEPCAGALNGWGSTEASTELHA